MKKNLSLILVVAMLVGLLLPAASAQGDVTEEPVVVTEPLPEEPTEVPTEEPTEVPTEEPTEVPAEEPTEVPTEEPTEAPAEEPTEVPAEEPTEEPAEEPTEEPAEEPTEEPTEENQEPVHFESGYVTVNGGTTVYKTMSRNDAAGSLNAACVVYARSASYAEAPENDWLKISFDTEETRAANGAPISGYVQAGAVTPLSEEETAAFLENQSALRPYQGISLSVAAFTAAVVEEAAPVEEVGAAAVPVITAQPVGASAAVGGMVTFSVKAENAETYRWQVSTDGGTTFNYCNNSLYPGYDTDTVTVKVTAARDGWLYRCRVAGGNAILFSEPAVLSVQADTTVSIISHPADATAAVGGTVTFSIKAENAESYRWQVSTDGGTTFNYCNNSLYPGYDTDTVTVKATAARDGWLYRCRVAGGATVLFSNPAALHVTSSVAIKEQPKDVSATAGGTVTFTVKAEGAESYRWQVSTDGGKTFNNCNSSLYPGQNTATVTVKVTEVRNGWLYRCRVAGGDTVLFTQPAALSVKSSLVITEQPKDVSAAAGGTVTFTVKAEGAESYRWQVSTDGGKTFNNCNSSLYPGQDTATVTVKVTEVRDGWLYRCRVAGGDTVLFTQPAALSVKSAVVITEQPKDVSAAAGGTATFTVKAEGAESYRWQASTDGGESFFNCSATAYGDVESDTLTVKATEARNGMLYRCRIAAGDTVLFSEAATLTVKEEITITITSQPKDVTAAVDEVVTFSVSVEVEEECTYRWQASIDGGETFFFCAAGAYGDVESDTLSVKATKARDGMLYRCRIAVGDTITFSEAAALTVSSDLTVDEVVYAKLEDNTLSVKSYLGSASSVVIPETVEGMTVTAIGESAFEGNTSLGSIDLPDTVTVIGKRAFAGCTSLSVMN